MWTDSLTTKEAEYSEEAIRALRSVHWAVPLIQRIDHAGGISSAVMPLLLEARVAYALLQLGMSPDYEYAPIAGAKTIDFRVKGDPEWLIEVFSLGESDAVKGATREEGSLSSVLLSSLSEDPRQSEEGEIIRAMERIADKALKFPSPSPTRRHVILTDMRGYLIKGGDHDDYREIAYGSRSVPPEHAHFWNDQPISGLFDKANIRKSAELVQQNIHFLGFLKEKDYQKGEIQEISFFLANPNLFSTKAEAVSSHSTNPLRRNAKTDVSVAGYAPEPED
jgi:hypothetical protein